MSDKREDRSDGLTRRDFVKSAALGAAGVAAVMAAPAGAASPVHRTALAALGQTAPEKSTVVRAYSPRGTREFELQEPVVREMFAAAMQQFTGTGSLGEAFAAIFPGITAGETVGLKVNWINRAVPTHPEVVKAIIEGLLQMPVAGGGTFPAGNIIVWDQHNLGLLAERVDIEGPVFKTYHGAGWDDDALVELSEPPDDGRWRYTKVLTRECTHLINCPVLKNHSTGVTGALKNHFGSVENPGGLHKVNIHRNTAELNVSPVVRDKTKLVVMDALVGVYDKGPGGVPMTWETMPDKTPNSILVGTDPVAVDSVGFDWIQAEREHPAHGFQRHPRCTHLEIAANLGLGIHERAPYERIELAEVAV